MDVFLQACNIIIKLLKMAILISNNGNLGGFFFLKCIAYLFLAASDLAFRLHVARRAGVLRLCGPGLNVLETMGFFFMDA